MSCRCVPPSACDATRAARCHHAAGATTGASIFQLLMRSSGSFAEQAIKVARFSNGYRQALADEPLDFVLSISRMRRSWAVQFDRVRCGLGVARSLFRRARKRRSVDQQRLGRWPTARRASIPGDGVSIRLGMSVRSARTRCGWFSPRRPDTSFHHVASHLRADDYAGTKRASH